MCQGNSFFAGFFEFLFQFILVMQSIDVLQTDHSVKIPFDFLTPELFAAAILLITVINQKHLIYYKCYTQDRFFFCVFFQVLNDWFRDSSWSACLPHLFDLLLLYNKIEIAQCFRDSKILIRSYQQKTWKSGLFCSSVFERQISV